MKENVGGADRAMRFVAGPAIMALGLTTLGGRRGRLPGLVTLVAGVLTLESAITAVCPVNRLIGVNTRRR
jgi:hypothetical protein